MNALEIVLAALVMGAGACLQGAVGFGSNLIAAPLLILLDDTFVPAPIVIASIVLNVLVMRREGRGSFDPTINTAMVSQVFGALLAGLVLAVVPERGLSLLFAALVLVAVGVSAAGWHLRPTRRTLAGAGAAAGFMGTISGIGGPPVALVYQRSDGPTLRATLSRFFLVGGFVSLVVLAATGKLGTENLLAIAVVVPASVAGFVVSGPLARRLDQGSVRPIVLGLSALAGAAVLVRELLSFAPVVRDDASDDGTVTGREVLLEVLRTEGVRHIFGNPGSTELPLIDALAEVDDIAYVLSLQEATAAGMADGYAQASGRPSFLNLHTSAGLGNAVGNLTNARANGTPIVVTAGQQDERHLAADPLLSGPLTEIAAPTCKWSHEVRSLGELGTILRRAFADAAKPPSGPVFASLRMDLLERSGPVGEVGAPPRSSLVLDAEAGGLEELADLLTGPTVGRVAIVVGDEVATARAQAGVAQLAEALGAPVHGSPLHSREVFDPTHPLWAGMLAPSAVAINAALSAYDRVLLIGSHAFLVYPYSPGSPIPAGTELLHLSPDVGALGRAHPVRLGVAGGVGPSVLALLPLVRARADAAAAADAVVEAADRRRRQVDDLDATARERYGAAPMHPMAAAHALVRSAPVGTAVVDEAITTGVYVRGFHHRAVDDGYFFCKGGGLGWGMPAACGVSLARDRSPVLCVVGDGSALYSPQALWTAAREQLPVVFAVVDNGQYRILKDYLRGMGGVSARTERFVAMDLEPRVDFVALATSLGVGATPVSSTGDIGDAVKAAVAAGGPHLLHVPITA